VVTRRKAIKKANISQNAKKETKFESNPIQKELMLSHMFNSRKITNPNCQSRMRFSETPNPGKYMERVG
jgi:hypothetical protein